MQEQHNKKANLVNNFLRSNGFSNIHAYNKNGESPITLVLKDHTNDLLYCVELLRALIKAGAKVNAHDEKLNSPLKIAAISKKSIFLTHFLLAHGANYREVEFLQQQPFAKIISLNPNLSKNILNATETAAFREAINSIQDAKFNADKLYLPKPKIENACFEGGGQACAAYIGVLKSLDKKGLINSLKRVGGSSGGSIVSLFLALGLSYEEIKQKILNIKLSDIQDSRKGDWFFFSKAKNFLQDGGIYPGIKLLDLFKNTIKDRLISLGLYGDKKHGKYDEYLTFKELKEIAAKYPEANFKELMVTMTNITSPSEVGTIYCDYESQSDLPIAFAVRASMSYPGAFIAPKIAYLKSGRVLCSIDFPNNAEYEKAKTIYGGGVVKEIRVADGGIIDNYPVDYFNSKKEYWPEAELYSYNKSSPNPNTIGFKIDSLDEIHHFNFGNASSPAKKLFNSAGILDLELCNKASQPQLKSDHVNNNNRYWLNVLAKAAFKTVFRAFELHSDMPKEHNHIITHQIYNQDIGALDFNVQENKALMQKLIDKAEENIDNVLENYHSNNGVYDIIEEFDSRLIENKKNGNLTEFLADLLVTKRKLQCEYLNIIQKGHKFLDENLTTAYYLQQRLSNIDKKINEVKEGIINHPSSFNANVIHNNNCMIQYNTIINSNLLKERSFNKLYEELKETQSLIQKNSLTASCA